MWKNIKRRKFKARVQYLVQYFVEYLVQYIMQYVGWYIVQYIVQYQKKIIFTFQKNLSVQKYARLCNAIINVKDCCKRNSGLLFPSSGGFSCDVPDKEYIYEVCQGSANGYTHPGPFQLGHYRGTGAGVCDQGVKIFFRMRG